MISFILKYKVTKKNAFIGFSLDFFHYLCKKINIKMKKGLILEGGGLRSLFSEGVFDVMLERGISVDGIIGVSAGASFGCNYKSKQIGRALRYNSNFAYDPEYVGLRSLLTTGDIVNGEYAYHVIPTEYDLFDWDTWNSNPTEFYLVTTDVETAKPIYQKIVDFDYKGLEWLRASASMPIVSNPVEIDGRKMLDGGITDSIPLEYFQSIGYEKNIVILTQPNGYLKKKTKLGPLFRIFCRKYPKIAEAMEQRHLMYNKQLDYIREQKNQGKTLVISPDDIIPIGRLEMKPYKMKHVYDMGRRTGLAYIDQIQEFLKD